MPERMTCPVLVQLVTEYLEGVMPPEDAAQFEEHLGRCPPCEVYLVQFRKTIEICGRLPEEVLPVEVKETLLAAFENWKANR
ncbi:MAG: zf-HC2 domain-containing protein [Dehalococcoidia bacterium]|nr:zf-HC2 domain-containing protein [Dehalococcoidia bacterium]